MPRKFTAVNTAIRMIATRMPTAVSVPSLCCQLSAQL
jgi:hypothetical protein